MDIWIVVMGGEYGMDFDCVVGAYSTDAHKPS